MKILTNPLSFYDLIERHQLALPTCLSEARKLQKESCKPSSSWGEFDFTDSDERRLRVHLQNIYDGEIKNSFISNFALRFLNMSQPNRKLENNTTTSMNVLNQEDAYPTLY
ncbi:hypothetical protein ACFSTH_00760 [Paenibacillus yanchengensis]|uniref:Uncharacterized protein n=1 Tax=Paenibacillus yanchengensis TaxID=2035833 RepID=A0ABW4YFX2_9BACL